MAVLKYYDEKLNKYLTLPLGTESVAVANWNYSTDEEIVVGRWTDGRPVYRKVMYGTTSTSGTTWNSVGIVSDIKEIVSVNMLLKSEDAGIIWPVTCYRYNTSSTPQVATWDFSNNSFNVLTTSNAQMLGASVTTIAEYTKTTDEAGSFDIEMLATGDLDTEATDDEVNAVLGIS